MTHVSTGGFGNNLAILFDVPDKIVTRFLFCGADVKIACQTILFIGESNLAMHHMVTCSDQSVSKSILLIIKNYFGPVCKLTGFLPRDF
jgi:hypothetical protein